MKMKPRSEVLSFQELSATLAVDQETEHLLRLIMENATQALRADRSTLFLVDRHNGELWSKIAQGLGIGEIRMPVTAGLAGYVARTGETVNIADAYADDRFNPDVDAGTGYRTTSVLCMPLRDPRGITVGVIEILNRQQGSFTAADEARLAGICGQAAVLVGALEVDLL